MYTQITRYQDKVYAGLSPSKTMWAGPMIDHIKGFKACKATMLRRTLLCTTNATDHSFNRSHLIMQEAYHMSNYSIYATSI